MAAVGEDDAPNDVLYEFPSGTKREIDATEGPVSITEVDRSGNVQRRWLLTEDDLVPIFAKGQSTSFFTQYEQEWRKSLTSAFLPVGYPHSVSPDYLAYQTCDSLQAFFSTISSLLANRALLQGLGVGDAESSATHALLLTIMKDAMSRVATIVFAHRFGLRIEPDAKKYRFLADLFNDTAFFLELYSPYLGPWGKVAALGTGEALRALCGVAAGASKAALSVHFARHDNLAELNAKEASQETAVGLIGLLVGTVVVQHVEDHSMVIYLMVVLVFAHLWMNFLGVRSVAMNTLNRQRATILLRRFEKDRVILTPKQVAAQERILFWTPRVAINRGRQYAHISYLTKWPRPCADDESRRSTVMVEDVCCIFYYHSIRRGSNAQIRIALQDPVSAFRVVQSWHAAMIIARVVKPNRPAKHGAIRHQDLIQAEALEQAGWNVQSAGMETGAPVRFRCEMDRKMQ